MTEAIPPLTARPAWRALAEHHARIRETHLRELFAADPARGERLAVEALGLYLDYSKNRITDETLRLLLATGRRIRAADADRRHVPGGEDQYHGGPGRSPRGPARSKGSDDPRRRRERGARGPRRARQDERLRPTASAAAPGGAIPASASATSSTSASAAPTSGR